jgi:hypothetical protein
MKNLTITHIFEFPIESLVKTREDRYNHPGLFPEVDRVEEEFCETKDNVVHRIRRIFMKNTLPSPADKVFRTNTLTAVEETWQSADFSSLKVVAKMDVFNGTVQFYEESLYSALDSDRSQRIISVEATAGIPLVGKAIETILVSEFKKRSDIDKEIIIKLRNESNF